jgi:regulator of protease activity HflC (stomatin/prohibitin superfamily)
MGQDTPFFLRASGISTLAIAAVIGIASLIAIPSLVENLDAHEVMVIQSPVDGTLVVHTDPGVKYQGFGKVTKYPRRAQYAFEAKSKTDEGNSKKLRFNDGGHANLSGSVSWEMPLKPDAIIAIHKTFGSAEGVEQQAVAKMLDAAIYLAGPLMSSTESSGERRAELVQAINDQAEHGVYVTRVIEKETKDPITGAIKSVSVTEIVRDKDGNPKRQQGSILGEFGIKLLPLSIKDLSYDKIVEDQIAQRQKATTEVQIAQANAKRAEQDAITIAKQGEATAAKAKWEQETIKAKEVTEAQQKLEVATLGAKEAEQYKREQILRGEGDAQRRAAVMNADGALDKKLETAVEINKVWAEAYAKYQGAQVPQVVFGNGSGQNGNAVTSAQNIMDMFAVKTARELGVDYGVAGKGNTAKK